MKSNLKREDFYNTKVNVSTWNDKSKSALQELAFELGFKWGLEPELGVKHLDAYGYSFDRAYILYTANENEHSGATKKEITYSDIFPPQAPKLARDNFDEEFDSMFSQNAKCMEAHEHSPSSPPKTSVDILNDCVKVQTERGVDYDKGEQKERSFTATSKAFNAITGKNITPAEVCLMLQIVKDVRQWSQDRLHEDSVLDGVSYASLKGEELYIQYQSTTKPD